MWKNLKKYIKFFKDNKKIADNIINSQERAIKKEMIIRELNYHDKRSLKLKKKLKELQ